MARVPSLAVLALIVLSCLPSCGKDRRDPVAVLPEHAPPLFESRVPFEERPHHAAVVIRDVRNGVRTRMDARAAFDPAVVTLFITDVDDVSEHQETEVQVELHPSGTPQFLHATSTSSGHHALIVGSVDFATAVSRIEWFEDADGDGVVENTSRVTWMVEPRAHLVRSAYDAVGGTLYVLDGLNERVLRLEDVDGDGRPDPSSRTIFHAHPRAYAGTLAPGRLFDPGPRSVSLGRGVSGDPVTFRAIHQGVGHLVDADQDGVAEQVTWKNIHGRPFQPLPIRALARDGDKQITLVTPVKATYRIAAVFAGGRPPELLASRVLLPGVHRVGLSRALVAEESIEVRGGRRASGRWDFTETRDRSAWFVEGWSAHTPSTVSPGMEVSIDGQGFDGSEVVTATLEGLGEDTGVACPVALGSHRALILTVPDLGREIFGRIRFRITRGRLAPSLSRLYDPQP